jgi:hypothetical protein
MGSVDTLIAVGEPALGRHVSGAGWDLGPLFLAIAALMCLRLVLAVRIRWWMGPLALLSAPPAIAFGAWVGPPVALALAGVGLVAARSILRSRRHLGTV